MKSATRPAFPPLADDGATDVCIVGAGITGLTTAYLLLKAGKSVIVLDDGPIVSGETERTTAHLTHALDDRYFALEQWHGEAGARLAAESHTAAMAMIERIVGDEAIACDLERVDGFLFRSEESEPDVLERELAATHRAGLPTEIVADAPVSLNGACRALRFPSQAQFHPLKYLAELANRVVQLGGKIHGDTHATQMHGGTEAQVETEAGPTVSCSAIVVATNTPVNDRVAIHTKQAAYRTYVITLAVTKGAIPRGLYWDTADPYHYVRLSRGEDAGEDLLIVGGEDHKTGQADDAAARYANLEHWARQIFPAARQVRHRWSGQVMEPVDGLAYLGRNPMDADNVYIATGDSGNGMTHGTIAGILITDLITGRTNPWEKLYAPSRITVSTAAEFIRENANVAAQYVDWFTAGAPEENPLIPVGTGAIVRDGLAKVAVYRAKDGSYHSCSAVCPHLGAIVTWNQGEQTWECPAHGSRFTVAGAVVNGPANVALHPVAALASPGR
jgi:glycine/D-amino acid oxidase-like deaminating enzyme/nitrite reductase/ring-hydroxylating ferredoxin subunit